ncbi:MAG: hypothetical protein HC820_10400 [Hydrococcus sp. RM1_1_31]|nr:hypothetical protein [Hydrococcus sp. RM1_1_31]
MIFKVKNFFQTNEEESIDTDDIIAFCLALAFFVTLCFSTWVIYKTNYIFNQECLNPLELVQNATTIEIAQKYLNLTMPKCQKICH